MAVAPALALVFTILWSILKHAAENKELGIALLQQVIQTRNGAWAQSKQSASVLMTKTYNMSMKLSQTIANSFLHQYWKFGAKIFIVLCYFASGSFFESPCMYLLLYIFNVLCLLYYIVLLFRPGIRTTPSRSCRARSQTKKPLFV